MARKKIKPRDFAPRLSLGIRISMHYAWLMFISIIPHLILFIVGYTAILGPGLYTNAKTAYECVLEGAVDRMPENMYFSLLNHEDQELSGNLPPYAPYRGYRFSADPDARRTYFRYDQDVPEDRVPPDGAARLALVFDISGELDLLIKLLILLAVLDMLRVFDFLHSGQGVSRRLFKPIDDIARTAQNLSASNLSERINIEGTKNELRDLAAVINEMLDRIEQAYNSQKQFVSDASHELRTPIAVIHGYAEMLDRWGKSEPEVRDEAISAILSETQCMKELLEKLLFLARHDKNTLKLEPDYFDAAELVEEVAKETLLIADDHVIRTGELMSLIIPGDRATLKQALRIFVDNALKYTPEGGVIALSCKSEDGACRMTVSDTGIGISEEDMPRVFDRFYRADPARSGGTDGHGLGLAIARIIVLSHGGKIEVQSKPGSGSRFHIILPM